MFDNNNSNSQRFFANNRVATSNNSSTSAEDLTPFGLSLKEEFSGIPEMADNHHICMHQSPTNCTPQGQDTCFDIDFE